MDDDVITRPRKQRRSSAASGSTRAPAQDLGGARGYFGTSSWKYEGWLGSIYSEELYKTRNELSKKKFEAECLTEYTRTFPTVCGDFAFYQFPTVDYWNRLFSQTPRDFLFGLKVPEDITVSTWPKHARYGTRAGRENEHFLNAKAFERFFANPLEPHKSQVGPLIFEFGTFNKTTFATPADYMAKLDPFLGSLPKGFRFSIEILNPEYLSPRLFRAPGQPQRRPRLQRLDADAVAVGPGATARCVYR